MFHDRIESACRGAKQLAYRSPIATRGRTLRHDPRAVQRGSGIPRLDADRDHRRASIDLMLGRIGARSPAVRVSGLCPTCGHCPKSGRTPDSIL